MWKSVVSWFCTVVCLHTHGEVRHFGSLRFTIHFWLIWYKNYRNRLILASYCKKFTATFFMAHGVHCQSTTAYEQTLCSCQEIWLTLASTKLHTAITSINNKPLLWRVQPQRQHSSGLASLHYLRKPKNTHFCLVAKILLMVYAKYLWHLYWRPSLDVIFLRFQT